MSTQTKTALATLEELMEMQKQGTLPAIDQISLVTLQQYFEQYILPYKYLYICNNKLEIEFDIKPRELCHLLFGTIESATPHANHYKGDLGYNRIKDGHTTVATLPAALRDKSKHKLKHFIFLNLLLEDPSIIYFNNKIAGNNFFEGSKIDAEFLLYKCVCSSNLHFFVKNGTGGTIAAVSFFPDTTGDYTNKQLALTVVEKKIIRK